jgi:hypothetical protein
MPYEHLRVSREQLQNERHRRQDRRPRYRPPDPRSFGAALRQRFREVIDPIAAADIGGYDPRRLLKIRLREGEQLPPLEAIPGVEVVSQEAESIVLAFATAAALDLVEQRLATLARDGEVTRAPLFYVIEDFGRWTREDRTGRALALSGVPDRPRFVLDVELWPVGDRHLQTRAFRAWVEAEGCDVLDSLSQPSLVMFRLRCDTRQVDLLLEHRDVRMVDLPPSVGLSIDLLVARADEFPPMPPPPDGAPLIGVLDSGLASAHPLLGAAVGDVQGYVEPNRDTADVAPRGHGTFVAGLALHGRMELAIQGRSFVPRLRLLAGKVFENDNEDRTEFVERSVEEAVRYFLAAYNCRVFNLSYGDRNKVYDGRHVRGLAYTLDRLSRELDVLFVVPTGNLLPHEVPIDPIAAYPRYLFSDDARLLDPAPALNALTVGALASNTATRQAQNHPNHIEDRPIALTDEPAPFSRRGPGVNGAIKPDLVDDGGNWAMPRAGGGLRSQGLGVVSLNSGFALGSLFAEECGTSFAAPLVAHKAALMSGRLAGSSPRLWRALLAAHAHWPEAAVNRLRPEADAEHRKQLLSLVGYGRVRDLGLTESLDDLVTLVAEDEMPVDAHHFYELPLPDEFWQGGRRQREITVALAYSPEVRTTRLDYRQSRVTFTLVAAASLDEVSAAFTPGREATASERSGSRLIPTTDRNAGSLQMSRWKFQQAPRDRPRLFVVVTRQDALWSQGRERPEPYALAVVVDDRANIHIELYDLIRTQLQARVQQRARARARAVV